MLKFTWPWKYYKNGVMIPAAAKSFLTKFTRPDARSDEFKILYGDMDKFFYNVSIAAPRITLNLVKEYTKGDEQAFVFSVHIAANEAGFGERTGGTMTLVGDKITVCGPQYMSQIG